MLLLYDIHPDYHRALRKHAAFFKGFESLDVVECMDSLRSEDFANDEDIEEVERSVSASGRTKAALKFLYSKLTKLSNDGLRYFVEDILPGLEETEVLLSTFQSCSGPGKCTLKPGQPHSLHEKSSADSESALKVS